LIVSYQSPHLNTREHPDSAHPCHSCIQK